MASLSVGIAIDMGKFWRELGTVRTALEDLSTQQAALAIGVTPAPGTGGGGGAGGGSLLKDVAAAAIAAKAAAGTIASPFLSLRVELRALGLEMSGAMHQSSEEMKSAGKSLKDVAQESAVQAGRLRQEDLEKHAAKLRSTAPDAPTAGAFNIPIGPVHAAGNAAEVTSGRFRRLGVALSAVGGAGVVALVKFAGGSAAAAGAAGGAAGAFVAMQGASAAAGAAVGVAAVSIGGAVAAMAPFAAGAAAGIVAFRGLAAAAKSIREVGLVQAFKNMRASFAESAASWIQGIREFKVNIEGVGKLLNVIPGVPLRASIGVIKAVVGSFMSYEDRVGRVARRMGLLETATKAAANVAAAPFKAANAVMGRMGTGGLIAAGSVAAGMGVAIKAGSDLNETLSKVDTVFGDASGGVKAEADDLANKFGVPKNTFLDSAASIGLIGKAAGQTEAQAAQFGSQFSKIALDMMSFYNVPVDEALKAVRSGLVGETEPMRRFGVLLSADRLEAEALRLGLIETGEEMTEQQKVQARASLMMKGLADANGDLARTANAPANLMRTLGGRLTNVASIIGQAVLPGVQSFLQLLNQMAIDAENGSSGIIAAFEWVGGAIKTVVDTIGVIYRNWEDFQEILTVHIATSFTNWGERLAWVQAIFSSVLDWIAQNYTTILPDAFEAVKTALMNLGQNIWNFFKEVFAFIRSGGRDPIELTWTPIMKGANFQSGEFVMPELKLSGPDQDRIDAANERINNRETERINNMKAAEKAKRGTVQEESLPEEDGKKKSNLGQKLDLAAFRDQLQQGLFDKDKKRQIKAAEDAAGAAKENVKEVKGLREDLKKAKGGLA